MNDKKTYVVLQVVDGEEGVMATYAPQIAMAHDYESMENAAISNVGSHPGAQKRGKPYRVIVIPWEAWNEFEVYSEKIKGRDSFRAYPSEDLTLQARKDVR
jgi:hypothetical protein